MVASTSDAGAPLICAAYSPDFNQIELYDSDDGLVGRHHLPKQLDQICLALPFLFVSCRQPLPDGEEGWQQILHVFYVSPNASEQLKLVSSLAIGQLCRSLIEPALARTKVF